MRAAAVTATLALVAVVGCGGHGTADEAPASRAPAVVREVPPTDPRDDWAAEAQAWHDSLRAAHLAEGGRAFELFLAPDVSWDESAVYAGDYGPAPIIGTEAIERAAVKAGPQSVRLEPDIFISVDALVDFWYVDWSSLHWDHRPDTREPAHGVGVMAIGPSGAASWVNGRASEDWHGRRAELPEVDQSEAIAALWTQVWSGDTGAVDSLYYRYARVEDTIAGIGVTGRTAISELATAGGEWRITNVGPDGVRGVYALVRRLDGVRVLGEVVLVVSGHDATGCARDMVLWLTLDDGLVTEEARYWSIEQARRCLPPGELPDGWWTDRAIPFPRPMTPATVPYEDLDTPTAPVVVGDVSIAVHNGTPALNRLLVWALGRFEAAGLTPPAITSVTFTSYSERCDEVRGLHRLTPAGSELTFCFDEETACRDPVCIAFLPAWKVTVLHELAHAWMLTELDDDVEQRFTDYVGLDAWDDRTAAWDRRAVEHAADTIAWGLMDRDVLLPYIGRTTAEGLTEGLRILTNAEPLPKSIEL